MMENTDKKRVNVLISNSLLKELNLFLADKHGNVFGHIGKSFEAGLQMWLKKQKRLAKKGSIQGDIE